MLNFLLFWRELFGGGGMFVVSCFRGGVKVGSYGFCDLENVVFLGGRDDVPCAALCDPGAVNGVGSNGICDPVRLELARLYALNGSPTLNESSNRPVLFAFGRGGGLFRGL
mmetsp:Transcript_5401/g.8026  ORF Transcript_5401/g.8026 Transcript_5401/m.8026 type:complete len:111 (+) Transcript_5401:562-894(+)